MTLTSRLLKLARRDRAAQRGSLIVTSLIILLGLAVTVGGTHLFMQEQMRQSYEIQKISFARLQALYLAEMGVNHLMYEANKSANVASANPFPVPAAAGSQIALNFKGNVAMVRADAGGAADCLVTRAAADAFRVDATLVGTGFGTFNRSVTFTVGKPASQWVLTGYRVL